MEFCILEGEYLFGSKHLFRIRKLSISHFCVRISWLISLAEREVTKARKVSMCLVMSQLNTCSCLLLSSFIYYHLLTKKKLHVNLLEVLFWTFNF